MREIKRDPAYLDDPVLLDYVQSLWEPLVDAARRRGDIGADSDLQFAWETFLVLDRSVNAFALPGGYVGLHLGLIAITASRDELASVMAHELSHVTQRHIARSVSNSSRQSMLGMVAMILGVLAASRSNSADMAQAAIAGSQAAVAQGQLNFSRDMEREADRIGYGVFTDAGFASGGMAAMFEKLDSAARLNDSGAFPYLRSHPLTVDRMSEARARVAFAANPAPESRYMHVLMQARAKVLMDPSAEALRRHLGLLAGKQPHRERIGVLYAAVLAASQLREAAVVEQAFAELTRLTSHDPRIDPELQRVVLWLRVETQLAQAEQLDPRVLEQAASLLKNLSASPARVSLLYRARLELQRKKLSPGLDQSLKDAAEALQTWVSEHRMDALAWSMLAQCAEELGWRLRSLRAQAEARAAVGDLSAAIDRLRAAQSASRGAAGADFIEASVIDSRLRDLEGQRRQVALDLRGGRTGGRGDERDPP